MPSKSKIWNCHSDPLADRQGGVGLPILNTLYASCFASQKVLSFIRKTNKCAYIRYVCTLWAKASWYFVQSPACTKSTDTHTHAYTQKDDNVGLFRHDLAIQIHESQQAVGVKSYRSCIKWLVCLALIREQICIVFYFIMFAYILYNIKSCKNCHLMYIKPIFVL